MVRNRPYWKLTCESCMRCLNHCPERAIEAAHGMAVGFYLLILTINTWITIGIMNLFNFDTEPGWLKILTQVSSLLLTIIVPAFFYVLIHYAMGIKPVRSFIRYTSLTTFRFWRRYKPDKRN
jgi:hypothetical protein